MDSLVFDRGVHLEAAVAALTVVEDLEVVEDGIGDVSPITRYCGWSIGRSICEDMGAHSVERSLSVQKCWSVPSADPPRRSV